MKLKTIICLMVAMVLSLMVVACNKPVDPETSGSNSTTTSQTTQSTTNSEVTSNGVTSETPSASEQPSVSENPSNSEQPSVSDDSENQAKVKAFNDAVTAIVYAYTPDCKNALDAAVELYNAIPTTHQSQASEKKAVLDGYIAQYEADKAAAEAAEADAQAKVKAFNDAVTAIVYAYTPDCKNALDAAVELYNAIPATHQDQASENKAVLDGYFAQYEADKAAAEAEAQAQESILVFNDAVTAIEYAYTLDCKALLDSALVLYNAIPVTHQDQVSENKAVLDGYFAQYEADKAAAEAEADAQAKILAFNNAVEAIEYAYTLDCKALLDSALELYNAIPVTHQDQASENKAVLDGYFAQYAEDQAAAEAQAQASILAFNDAVTAIEYAYTLDCKALLDSALELYNAIPATHQDQVSENKAVLDGYFAQYAEDQAAAEAEAQAQASILAFNNAVTAIEYAYTLDCKALLDSALELYNAIPSTHQDQASENKAVLDDYFAQYQADAEAEAQAQASILAFNNAVTAIEYAYTLDCKTLLDSALELYNAIPATHQDQASENKAVLDGYFAQYEADDAYAKLPQEVKDVIEAINVIGEITVANYVEKDVEVAGIETAYAELSVENQALVSNFEILEAARSTIDTIKAEQAAIQEKIDDFKTKVGAITVENTTACLTAINEAYAAYGLIPADRQSDVTVEKATLDGYKAQYDALVKAAADQAVVDAFMTNYNAAVALGEVTTDNQATIQAVIDAYGELTADQLALLDASVSTQISAWETAIEALQPAGPLTIDFETASDFTVVKDTNNTTNTKVSLSGDSTSITGMSGSGNFFGVFFNSCKGTVTATYNTAISGSITSLSFNAYSSDKNKTSLTIEISKSGDFTDAVTLWTGSSYDAGATSNKTWGAMFTASSLPTNQGGTLRIILNSGTSTGKYVGIDNLVLNFD